MEKDVTEIQNVSYGQDNISCEPTLWEIAEAVDNGNLEERAFQGNLDKLISDWEKDPQQKYNRIRTYHARRIAYFVVNGWSDPIILKSDGRTVVDGLHRYKAALFMQKKKIEVFIESITS